MCVRVFPQGVLIKGGRPLELLGNLKAASFDKSGTLTEGHFQLTKVHTFEHFSKQQALQLHRRRIGSTCDATAS